ncbi:MAG TPA: DUF6084 family protein [Gemmatimonadales bacterium]|jgi:hypothetical protein|nr:DUF6084 family protein [Gemmatimonadales bacterium]
MTAPRTIAAAPPELAFTVERVFAVHHAVAPAIGFAVHVTTADAAPVAAISLQVQLRLNAAARRYTPDERSALAPLMGTGEQWGRANGSLHWANITAVVPPFDGPVTVELLAPLTYDFDVTTAQYLHALQDGAVPVDLLFSGTVFYHDADGLLQAAMIPWDREAHTVLPVSVWREAMDQHFPGSGWIRLSRHTLSRLVSYRAQHAMDFDGALNALLGEHLA